MDHDTPAAKAWRKKFQRVLRECPKGYWLFAVNNGILLMKDGPDGKPVMKGGGFSPGFDDRAAVGAKMTGPWIDGGDW